MYNKKSTISEKKFLKLKKIIKEINSVVIAFSGGTDSSFLLAVASQSPGEKVIAVTAKSPTYTGRELKEVKAAANKLGCRHIIINTNELEIEEFINNPRNRCYFCKKELFLKLISIKNKYKFDFVADGTNYDDLNKYRPGLRALKELGIRSPLAEAGLTKEEIRQYSELLNLPTWNKPDLSCLASRLPYGEKISKSVLKKIEKAEDFLYSLGFRQIRIRYHDPIARIELGKDEIPKILQYNNMEKIIRRLKRMGFEYITLDLEGYRSGSMDRF
ncbi:MAG: ATP-dependent sacrificial sulfur transferase LarE [Actinomycetota bacterium]|nr:ATP-dependent sacrificial sulfur transferase LarE [Actinomycetota bacterium]